MMKKKICLITNGHISSNPKIVKEADALSDAGYEVTVISSQHIPALSAHDSKLHSNKRWAWKRIIWGMRENFFLFNLLRIKHFIYRNIPRLFWTIHLVAGSIDRTSGQLTKMAQNEIADLYIAHNLAALSPAAIAAAHNNAKYAFDAEDFHSEEILDKKQSVRAEFIERKYFIGCVYITASSEPIAIAYADKYGIPKPTTILNVFPISHVQENKQTPKMDALSLYWFSQTIGPDRGIEDVIGAMGLSKHDIRLTLQGAISPRYKDALIRYAARNNVSENRITLLNPVEPEKIFHAASQFDIGLALERSCPLNRNLCISNKIFTYLLAGLSIVAVETMGQRMIINSIGDAGWMYPEGDINALSKRLDALASDRKLLDSSKKTALYHAKKRYNWDLEKNILLGIVSKTLG